MLQNPIFRWGVGLSGAIVVAVVSYVFLTGTVQLVAYGIAAFDGVMTPLILKRVAAE